MDWDLVLVCSLRLVVALILGFAIGYERKMRFKEAGIRTHTIVCLGACLYMLISVFAFKGADTSRVAAQIVSGIGFIGAGMIFYHKEMVHGLTTAAGIWATAAIGMTVGAGWYLISLIATILIILVQCIMHLNVKVFHSHRFVKINVIFIDEQGMVSERIKEMFNVERFNRISAKRDNGVLTYSVVISTDKIISASEIHKLLIDNKEIISIVRQDDDF
ncbi:MAG: MgtC/SapB family protein [Clostridiales bacterium]|nr:MgtC/SapB family protein [Clostridiales bacterium]